MTGGVVVVGGGLAGQRCIQALRSKGYDGRLTLVGAEPHLPYDRPPLSKAVLAGEASPADVELRPEAWYADREVELVLGRAASELRPAEHALVLEGGDVLRYRRLLVATGSRPRRLSVLRDSANVHVLRSLDDAVALREVLIAGARLAIVGAGFIGQEVASTARGLGVEVTLVEGSPLPLGHVLGEGLGRWLGELHAAEGVDVRVAATVARGLGNGRIEALELSGGERIETDAVLVGVGVEAATEWVRGGGLEPGALRADAAGATVALDVFAAGDAAGGHHWDAAVRQGIAAAHGILGLAPPALPPPTFWSDQYGMRLQLVGAPAGHDRVEIDGDPAARDFHAVFHRSGRPVAGFAVGRPQELPRLRALINQSTTR